MTAGHQDTSSAPAITPRPLATKLARVLGEIGRVPKNGRNEFHKYDFVQESDIVDHIRGKLSEQGVFVFPSVANYDTESIEVQTKRGKRTEYLSTVTLQITMVDGESGDQMVTTWVGQGSDTGDKGFYKAYTGAMKYFMLKTFMVSTGDDPEIDRPRKVPTPRGDRPAQRPQRAPTHAERREEMTAQLLEVVDLGTARAFIREYVVAMRAESFEAIALEKIGSMISKLRAMTFLERQDYVGEIVTAALEQDAEPEHEPEADATDVGNPGMPHQFAEAEVVTDYSETKKKAWNSARKNFFARLTEYEQATGDKGLKERHHRWFVANHGRTSLKHVDPRFIQGWFTTLDAMFSDEQRMLWVQERQAEAGERDAA